MESKTIKEISKTKEGGLVYWEYVLEDEPPVIDYRSFKK